ncbi:MAG: hypothetical protein MSB12_01635 [Lentisphaeraceae bacterium]|nr:hypothetical protein [Lentisphaeraceae bacterium]
MKQNAIASLAALALLSAGSLAYAAEVTGGNVAVVVQRASVPSASGYQLLCVPVKGLDITGSADSSAALTLDQVLPPAAYGVQPANEASIGTTEQCRVTIFKDSVIIAKIKASASTSNDVTTWSYAWKSENGDNNLGTEPLACGTVLWFYNPSDVSTQQSSGSIFAPAPVTLASAESETSDSKVTFCGQQNGAQSAINNEGGTNTLQKIGNETSEAIALSTLFTDANCAVGTQLFRIATKGDANYTIYKKRAANSWTMLKPNGGIQTGLSLDNVMLAPGEAIYYFAIAPQQP